MIPSVYDVDDLISRDQIEKYLVPLKEANPDFALTAYTVPNRMGEVHQLAEEFPWITFAIHGFEHSQFECASWTEQRALTLIRRALELGYAPLFKAPNWILDSEVEKALVELHVMLHHHEIQKPRTSGLLCYPGPHKPPFRFGRAHTHILENPVTDFITVHPLFQPEHVRQVPQFLNIMDMVQVLA